MSNPSNFTIHCEQRAGHWTSWVTADNETTAAGAVVLVGQTQEEAEANLPGDAFFDNDNWIEGPDAWDDDAIDAAINVALATDDTRTIEGIERSLQMYKDDMTASEWRGAKGRRYREIQAILDRRREERNRATRTEPPERERPLGREEQRVRDLSDEDLEERIGQWEDTPNRTPEEEARLTVLSNEYERRFPYGEGSPESLAREQDDLDERLEWY